MGHFHDQPGARQKHCKGMNVFVSTEGVNLSKLTLHVKNKVCWKPGTAVFFQNVHYRVFSSGASLVRLDRRQPVGGLILWEEEKNCHSMFTFFEVFRE